MKSLFVLLLMGIGIWAIGAEDYHKQNKDEAEQLGPQHSPLGFLGASGIFQVGKDAIEVKNVFSKGIAYDGGLQEGDIIIAANGKAFEKATNNIDDGGKGPREDLGMAMDNSLSSQYKTLSLTVLRKDKKLELTLYLSSVEAFAKNYPFYCKRSEETLEQLCKKLLEYQRPDGSWGGPVQTSTAGLGLLASGEKKYMKAVKKAAYHLADKQLKTGGLPTWNYIYAGTFLCEYYLATGDYKVLEKIKYISDTLALEATSENGRHAHGITTEPGYDGKGINIISTQVFLVWALAEKCGVKIHEKPFKATLAHLKKCTESEGGTGYIGAYGNGDGSGRTGLFTLGLYISGEDKKLQKIQGKYLERHTKRMRECHANGLFGMIWGSAALACVNPKGFRKHMDYWRWYMNMGKTPKGHDLVQYYIGSRRNNGGDGYLGWDLYNHATMAMIFSIGRKKLFVHGNTNRNWFNNNHGEALVQFYSKIHKDKSELLDFLSTKKEELSSQSQLKETLKFLKNELRGNNKGKATELYTSILSVVDSRIESINSLAQLKPVEAYSYYLSFKDMFRNDRQFTKKLDLKLKSLFSNKKIFELHKLVKELDKILADSIDLAKNSRKLESIKKSLETFVMKNSTQRELSIEAQLLIEKIDLNLQNLL